MLVTVSCDRLFRDRPLSGKTAIVIGSLGSTVNSSHVFGRIITDGQTICFSQRTNRCIGRAVVSENKSITALGIFRLKDLAVDHDLCRLDIKCDKDFKDIYDLVEWCCEEDAARALAGQKTYDTWQQGFLQILEALRKDKAFFTSVYRSISREQLENYLYRLTYDLMMGVVEERAAGMTVRPEDKEFIANFYKFAFVGLTLDWIKNDMRQDPAQLVEQLSTLIHGDVTKALEKCRIDKS